MKFKIVKLPELSGPACKIYSIMYDGVDKSLYDIFDESVYDAYPDESDEIWNRLKFMGKEGGARIQFFREDEGRRGDGIVALLKKKQFSLRVYCIRYGGNGPLVVGNGGVKKVRAWQDDPHLTACVEELMEISSLITKRILDKDISIAADGSFQGDLVFENEEDEQ